MYANVDYVGSPSTSSARRGKKQAEDKERQGSIKNKKRTSYVQKFSAKWLIDAELKDWLRQDKRDKTRSWCLACNKSINGNITTMHRYAKAPLHLRNMKLLEESTKSSSFVIDQIQFRGSRDDLVTKLELSLAAWVALKDLPLTVMDLP